jgi:2-(3-amino-3-carboxypropyl)histidine synthase
MKTLKELNEKYDLELNKVVSEIKKKKAKLVLLQFPDGLKPYATCVVDYLSEKTNAEFLIWFDTCFGACDTPVGLEKISPKIDLVIQFGHNEIMPDY